MAMASCQGTEVGGYDATFVRPLDKEFECPVCLLAMREPVQTPCGHEFCKSCFHRVARQQGAGDEATCPLDKQKFPLSAVLCNVKEHRKILDLKVKCMNKLEQPLDHLTANYWGDTCRWTGELRLYKGHLKDCRYEKVPCENDCGKNLQRWRLSKHLGNYCVRRRLNCEHCAIELEQRQMEAHLTKCPKLPILCHLECGQTVKRENMARHVSVSGNCPNTLLSCPFKDAGCDVKEKRHQLQKHLADSVVEHQLKQQQKISRLQDKSKELEQKLVVNAETQLKQQQKIFLLQYKNEELEQKLIVNAETQLKQQQLISELQAENNKRKRRLVGNDLFNNPVKQTLCFRY